MVPPLHMSNWRASPIRDVFLATQTSNWVFLPFFDGQSDKFRQHPAQTLSAEQWRHAWRGNK
jgi:hypothetical protein